MGDVQMIVFCFDFGGILYHGFSQMKALYFNT